MIRPRRDLLRRAGAALLAAGFGAARAWAGVATEPFDQPSDLLTDWRLLSVEGFSPPWRPLFLRRQDPLGPAGEDPPGPDLLDGPTGIDRRLVIEPWPSAWWGDLIGGFLFRRVIGDFRIGARFRVTDRRGFNPGLPLSLGGLMVRRPRPGLTARSWRPRDENWVMVGTGTSLTKGLPALSLLSTANSLTDAEFRQGTASWVVLGLRRVGRRIHLAARQDDQPWLDLAILDRPDLGAEVEVGVAASNDWRQAGRHLDDPRPALVAGIGDGAPAALRVEVDWLMLEGPGVEVPGVEGPGVEGPGVEGPGVEGPGADRYAP